jgi:hypothetical protein
MPAFCDLHPGKVPTYMVTPQFPKCAHAKDAVWLTALKMKIFLEMKTLVYESILSLLNTEYMNVVKFWPNISLTTCMCLHHWRAGASRHSS